MYLHISFEYTFAKERKRVDMWNFLKTIWDEEWEFMIIIFALDRNKGMRMNIGRERWACKSEWQDRRCVSLWQSFWTSELDLTFFIYSDSVANSSVMFQRYRLIGRRYRETQNICSFHMGLSLHIPPSILVVITQDFTSWFLI